MARHQRPIGGIHVAMVMHARDLRCTLGTSARIQLAAGKTSFGPPAFASLPTFTQITNALSHHGHGLHDRTHEYYLRHAHAALKSSLFISITPDFARLAQERLPTSARCFKKFMIALPHTNLPKPLLHGPSEAYT